jgi:hypothetical protein
MIVRMLVIAASALAGALGTLFVREKVFGDDPGPPTLPDHVFRPRPRRVPRGHLDARPDGESVPQ